MQQQEQTPIEQAPETVGVVRVSERFGVNVATVYRWLDRGWIPSSSIGGRYIILKSDIDSIITRGDQAYQGAVPMKMYPQALYEADNVSQS